MKSQTYIAGVCNLGKDEIQKRYRMGWTGLAVLVILVLIIQFLQPGRGFRLLIIIPLYYTLSGFIQARHRFCFVYGYLGVYSLLALRDVHRVADAEDRRKDRVKALRIVGAITFASLLLTLAYYFI